MKLKIGVVALCCVPFCALAQGGVKPCDELKGEIAKKLDAKGVVGYSLTVADKGKEGDGKVIGSCNGGMGSIVYSRDGGTVGSGAASAAGAAPAAKPAVKAEKKPQ